MFHTCLAVEWTRTESEVLGVAKQTAWIRPEHSEEKVAKAQEEKESQVWLNTLKEIGRPPIGSRWVSHLEETLKDVQNTKKLLA